MAVRAALCRRGRFFHPASASHPPMCPAHAVSRKLKRAQFAANVRVVQQLDREGLELLLRHQLPCWVKVRL